MSKRKAPEGTNGTLDVNSIGPNSKKTKPTTQEEKKELSTWCCDMESIKGIPWADLDKVYLGPNGHLRELDSHLPSILLTKGGGCKFYGTSEFAKMLYGNQLEQPQQPKQTPVRPTPSVLTEKGVCLTFNDIIKSVSQVDIEDNVQPEPPTQALPKPSTITNKPSVPIGFEFKNNMKELTSRIGHGIRLVGKEVNENHNRSFGIVWYPHFLKDLYYNIRPDYRSFHECIGSEEPCRLHLDIEMDLAYEDPKQTPMSVENLEKRFKKFRIVMGGHVRAFVRELLNSIGREFDLKKGESFSNGRPFRGSYLILDSSNKNKFSLHVIVSLDEDRILFKNRRSVGNFVKLVLARELANKVFSDPHGLFTSKKSESKVHPFTEYMQSKGQSNPVKWNFVTIYKEEKYDSLVPYQLMLDCLDVDVYYADREFRMFASTKYKQKRSLKYSKRYEFKMESGRGTKNYKLTELKLDTLASSDIVYYEAPPSTKNIFEDVFSVKATTNKGEEEYDDFLFGDEDSKCLKIDSGDAELEDLKQFLFEPSKGREEIIAKKLSKFEVFSKVFYESLVVPFWHHRSLSNNSEEAYSVINSDEVPRCLLYCVDPKAEHKLRLENCLDVRKAVLRKLVEDKRKTLNLPSPGPKQKMYKEGVPLLKTHSTPNRGEVEVGIWEFFSDYSDNNPYACLQPYCATPEEVGEFLPSMLTEIFGDVEEDSDSEEGDEIDLNSSNCQDDDLFGINLITAVQSNIEVKMRILEIPNARLSYVKETKDEGKGGHCIWFLLEGSRMCQIRAIMTGDPEACHSNNNIYFVARLNDYQFYQKCYAPDCREYYAKNVAKINPSDAMNYETAKKNTRGNYYTLDPLLQGRIERHKRRYARFVKLYEEMNKSENARVQ